MSVVTLTNITVLDNPTKFTNPFQFDIVFECIAPLREDLEFKIIYVGSAENDRHDQVLDSIMVGPVPVGVNKFVFQADPPNANLIPPEEVLGVTVVLIVCSYNDQEFIRVGYYVNNEYETEELRENPPEVIQFDKVVRNILSDKPRVTRIPIRWDDRVDPEIVPPPPQEEPDESTLINGQEDEEMDGFGSEEDEASQPEQENTANYDDEMAIDKGVNL